jgi:hypothetical protein
LVSFGIIWYRLVSFGIVWYPLVSFGIVWYRLVSFGIVWYHLVSFGILWYPLVSFGILWYRLLQVAKTARWQKLLADFFSPKPQPTHKNGHLAPTMRLHLPPPRHITTLQPPLLFAIHSS